MHEDTELFLRRLGIGIKFPRIILFCFVLYTLNTRNSISVNFKVQIELKTLPQKRLFVKLGVFWDVAPCSQVDVDRRFRGAYCLHHQGDDGTSVNIILTTRRYIP
jgi:hypothetical protein